MHTGLAPKGQGALPCGEKAPNIVFCADVMGNDFGIVLY